MPISTACNDRSACNHRPACNDELVFPFDADDADFVQVPKAPDSKDPYFVPVYKAPDSKDPYFVPVYKAPDYKAPYFSDLLGSSSHSSLNNPISIKKERVAKGLFGKNLEQNYPLRTASNQAAPNQAAPNQAAPNQAAPKQAAPKQAAPKQAAPKPADLHDRPATSEHHLGDNSTGVLLGVFFMEGFK